MSPRREPSTRSPSSDSSAFSNIDVSHVDRSAETLTPPTSISDGRSVQNSVKAEDDASSVARPRRSRAAPTTYNVAQLSMAQLSSDGDRSRKRPRDAGSTEDEDEDALPRKAARNSLGGKALSSSPSIKLQSRASQKKGFSQRVKDAGLSLGKRSRQVVEAGKRNIRPVGKRATSTVVADRQKKLLKELDTGPRGLLDEIDLDVSYPVPIGVRSTKSSKKGTLAPPTASLQIPPIPTDPMQKTSSGKRVKKYMQAGLFAGQDLSADPDYKKDKSSSIGNDVKDQTFMPLPMFKYLDNARNFIVPFDIFAPTWRKGDEKPKDWHKINQNRLVGEAKDLWAKEDRLAASVCVCPTPKHGELGCEEDCLNRVMQYECNEDNCALPAAQCSNRAFVELAARIKKGGAYDIGVEVIKTENRGFGVRAVRSFNPGQIIMEYTGEIISEGECQRRMREEYKDKQCYYLMELERNLVIDGTKGSMARFINHSCEPNCEVRMVKVNGKHRMAVYAGTSGIMTGEELTYDYNFDNFGETRQNCYCGAKNCRGFLSKRLNATEQKKLARAEEARKAQAAVEAQKAAEVEAKKKEVKDARGSGWRGWVSVDDAEVKAQLRAEKRAREEAEKSSSRAMRLAARRDTTVGGAKASKKTTVSAKAVASNRRKTTALTELGGRRSSAENDENLGSNDPAASVSRKRRHTLGAAENDNESEVQASPSRKKHRSASPTSAPAPSDSAEDSGGDIQVAAPAASIVIEKTTVELSIEALDDTQSDVASRAKTSRQPMSTLKYKQSTLNFAKVG